MVPRSPSAQIGEALLRLAAGADLVGTNLKAPLFLAQAAAPALRHNGGPLLEPLQGVD